MTQLNNDLIRTIHFEMRKNGIYLISTYNYFDNNYYHHRMTRHCTAKKIYNKFIRSWAFDDRNNTVSKALANDNLGSAQDSFKFLCLDDNPDIKLAYPLYIAFDRHQDSDRPSLDPWYQLPSTKILIALQHYESVES